MKSCMKLIRAASVLGQLGFTLITPPVVMALLGWWLQSRFGLGAWIMLVCLAVGLFTAAANAYRFYRRVLASAGKKAEKEPETKPVTFYRHE